MEDSPRVVHLTSVHRVDDTRIFQKECRSLAEAGFEVTLFAPASGDSQQDGVHIRALRPARTRRQRMTRGPLSVCRFALNRQASIYHFHDPELIPVALLVKLLGRTVIYDAHEDLAKQVLSKYWIPKWLRFPLSYLSRGLELLAGWQLDRIVAATPAIRRQYPQHKTVLVQNYPLLDELRSTSAQIHSLREHRVAFVGVVTQIRGAIEMVQAMAPVGAETGAKLVIAGDIAPASFAETLRREPGWQHIECLGWRNRQELREVLATCRAGLVLFHPEPNHVEAQPNKLFEYMAAGLPVVASDFPGWREIVEGEGCGLLVDPFDVKDIARSISWILEHPDDAERMGANGRRAVETRFNWTTEADTLISVYEDLTSGRTRR